MELNLLTTVILSIIIPISIFLFFTKSKTASPPPSNLPKAYPIIGSSLEILRNKRRLVPWLSDILTSTPTLTYTLNRGFGRRHVFTANAANVQYILKTNFSNYEKGQHFTSTLKDLLGEGIFNVDGEDWKFQRQVSSNEFNTKSLRKFIEQVVDTEITDRLIPILQTAADNNTVIDFQDILLRFAFDNICRIAFGYDPEYLMPSMPPARFAVAYDKAVELSTRRLRSVVPNLWRVKRALNFESEKQLKAAVDEVRGFAKELIRRKKTRPLSAESVDDLLSRFLFSGHSDELLVTDIVICFILAGKDSTSAALTWFFWILSKHPEVEKQILIEAREISDSASGYDEVKHMIYTHASLCESMRLYPPVPVDPKAAASDDVLPDGTVIKKGMRVSYHPYAMGRVEKVWGKDWAEFRPTRWLEKAAGDDDKWSFVDKDQYTYPVFQAGPRICLGKNMAFVQMKRVVASVLRQFKVVPTLPDGETPVFVAELTAKMKGGFPVRIEKRT